MKAMSKTTTRHSTEQSGNAETGFITIDRDIQTWHEGQYAGREYMITTYWRGTAPGARHIMTRSSSAPYSR
jgi:hypothetical protein